MPLSALARFPWRLFLAFTALDCFRYCFLRASEYSLGAASVPAFCEPLRLPYYLAILLGTLFALLLGKRLESMRPAYHAALLALTLALAASSLWQTGTIKLVLMLAGFFMSAALICLCMRSIAMSVPFAALGRFIAFSFAASNFAGSAYLFMYAAPPAWHALILAVLSLGVIPLKMTAPKAAAAYEVAESKLEPAPSRSVVLRFAAVLALYSFIAGVLYNLFFVSEGKANEPGLYFLVLLASSAIYIATGILLDRAQWCVTIISLFALITIGQSLSFFFSSESVLALPFSYITMGGFIALDAVTVIIPLYYMKKLGKRHLAGIGYAFLYGGLFITTLLLRFAPESLHRAVLAGMLIASPAAMLLAVAINSSSAKAKYEHTLKMAGTTVAPNRLSGESQAEAFRRCGFTNREAEALRLLLSGCTNSMIAKKMMVTENTVYKYISSVMAKAEVKSRSALFTIYSHLK